MVHKPLQSSVTGPSLLGNCYLENKKVSNTDVYSLYTDSVSIDHTNRRTYAHIVPIPVAFTVKGS